MCRHIAWRPECFILKTSQNGQENLHLYKKSSSSEPRVKDNIFASEIESSANANPIFTVKLKRLFTKRLSAFHSGIVWFIVWLHLAGLDFGFAFMVLLFITAICSGMLCGQRETRIRSVLDIPWQNNSLSCWGASDFCKRIVQFHGFCRYPIYIGWIEYRSHSMSITISNMLALFRGWIFKIVGIETMCVHERCFRLRWRSKDL